MKKLAAITVTTAAVAVVALNGAPVMAESGSGSSSSTSTSSSGTWPASLPLPTSPGTVLSQSSTSAVVRSTDMVWDVKQKLDAMYAQLGCTKRLLVNRPREYTCGNQVVWFTFAALDPKPGDPSRSQTNAFR